MVISEELKQVEENKKKINSRAIVIGISVCCFSKRFGFQLLNKEISLASHFGYFFAEIRMSIAIVLLD